MPSFIKLCALASVLVQKLAPKRLDWDRHQTDLNPNINHPLLSCPCAPPPPPQINPHQFCNIITIWMWQVHGTGGLVDLTGTHISLLPASISVRTDKLDDHFTTKVQGQGGGGQILPTRGIMRGGGLTGTHISHLPASISVRTDKLDDHLTTKVLGQWSSSNALIRSLNF